MKIQIAVLLAIVSALAAEDSAQVYCGRELARTMAAICFETYSNQAKRSGDYELYDKGEFASPWLAPSTAQRLNFGRGKKSDGIASECCDKPCTMEEMASYC